MLKSNYSLIKVRSCSREYYRAKGVYFPLPMIRNNPKHLTFVLTPTPTYGYILHCTRCMHKKKKGKGKKGDYNYILAHRSWAHPMLYKKKQRFCYTGSKWWKWHKECKKMKKNFLGPNGLVSAPTFSKSSQHTIMILYSRIFAFFCIALDALRTYVCLNYSSSISGCLETTAWLSSFDFCATEIATTCDSGKVFGIIRWKVLYLGGPIRLTNLDKTFWWGREGGTYRQLSNYVKQQQTQWHSTKNIKKHKIYFFLKTDMCCGFVIFYFWL